MKKACSFCGIGLTKSNRATEHVIPQWLFELLSIGRDEQHTAKGVTPAGVVLEERSFGARNIVYGNVCKGCNGGWLSDLEGKVQKTFERLFTRKNLILTPAETSALRFWVYKTSLLLALTADNERKSLVPTAALSELYSRRTVPTDIVVDLLTVIPPCNLKAQAVIRRPEFIQIEPNLLTKSDFALLTYRSTGFVVMLQFDFIVLRLTHVGPRVVWNIADANQVPHVNIMENTRAKLDWPPKIWKGKNLHDFARGLAFIRK